MPDPEESGTPEPDDAGTPEPDDAGILAAPAPDVSDRVGKALHDICHTLLTTIPQGAYTPDDVRAFTNLEALVHTVRVHMTSPSAESMAAAATAVNAALGIRMMPTCDKVRAAWIAAGVKNPPDESQGCNSDDDDTPLAQRQAPVANPKSKPTAAKPAAAKPSAVKTEPKPTAVKEPKPAMKRSATTTDREAAAGAPDSSEAKRKRKTGAGAPDSP